MIPFILLLSLFAISNNVSSYASYLRGIHYPIEHDHSRDCQFEYTGLRGVCKRFKECQSAQKGWFGAKIYPSLCYYYRFEAIVCCTDEESSIFIQPFVDNSNNKIPNVVTQTNGNNQFPINNENNRITSSNQFPIMTVFDQGSFPNTNNQNRQENRPSTNNQFPLGAGNNQENFPNTNSQFPIFGNEQQGRPSSNNQFLVSTGNDKGNFPSTNNQLPISTGNTPNTNNQFPIFNNEQHNRPNTNNQFPINNENNQGNIPNVNNQFPISTNVQQNRPIPNNQFPISAGNNQGNFPNTNNQFPILNNDQHNRPNTNNQFPINNENNQGNFPNVNNQFPISTNVQQNRPIQNNQFPISAGNNQGNFPNTNNQFPILNNDQHNRPNTNNQFPINNGNNQGDFPNTNNQFPTSNNKQQNRPFPNNQFPISSENNPSNFPNMNNQFQIFNNGQQNHPNPNNQFPINTGNNQQNILDINNQQNPTNTQFPIDTGNSQGNFPNTNNQFPTSSNEQQNRPIPNTQFPINTGNSPGNFPNTNNQFPIFNNGQQNRPNLNNQFPINSGNNQVNPQNSNNQIPVGPVEIQPDIEDCTVVILASKDHPVGSRCVVPNQDYNQQNNQNQNGQMSTLNAPSNSGVQQDQPTNSNQAQTLNEPEEEYNQPRLSQEMCEAVYDVTPLVGGEPTKIGEYPFMAAIGWKRFDNEIEFNCGGFLLSKDYVLTAAHCSNLGGDKPFAVRTGGIDLDNTTSSNLDIPIEEIIIHPDYHENQTYNDIALMKLTRKAEDEIACLWQKNEVDKEYEEVKAIGYGHTHFGGPRSNSLLQIRLKLFGNEQCSPYYKPEPRFPNGIIDSQICSGDLTRAKDTCQGDSGGPIFIERTSTVGRLTPIVIGITSFGQGCAGEAPSIYTRISSYLNWIEPIVWPNFY